MDDANREIFEDEIDTLAGRMGDAEARLELIVKLLSTPPVVNVLGLDPKRVAEQCHVVMRGADRWRHATERRQKLAQANLDAFRRRVTHAESVMEQTGRPFPETWAASSGAYGDVPKRSPRRTATNAWDRTLAHLEKMINRYSFATWFEQTSLVRDDGETLIVRAGDELTAAWLQSHYEKKVADAVAAIGRPTTRVQFVKDAIALAPPTRQATPAASRRRRRRASGRAAATRRVRRR